MTWEQAHPPGTTSVASTKTQFQQNNLYIENTMQVDHYFDDATASNDGHHKFVQMPVQGADPGVAIAGGGCYFLKNTGLANPSPYIQIGGKTYQVPVALNCGSFVCPSGTTRTFNFAGYPSIRGMLYAYNTASPRKAIGSTFIWTGANLYINERNQGKGQFTADGDNHLRQYTSSGSSFVKIITDQNITVNLSWWGHIV